MDAENDPTSSQHENEGQNFVEEVNPAQVARESSAEIEEAQKDFESFCKTNPEIEDRSLRIVKKILKRLHGAMTKLNELKSDDK